MPCAKNFFGADNYLNFNKFIVSASGSQGELGDVPAKYVEKENGLFDISVELG